jgi:chaperonin cofactor prefoldin
MKTVSLTILRNETNKCLADIEDEKKNYNIRISRVEREIEHVNDQVRKLR